MQILLDLVHEGNQSLGRYSTDCDSSMYLPRLLVHHLLQAGALISLDIDASLKCGWKLTRLPSSPIRSPHFRHARPRSRMLHPRNATSSWSCVSHCTSFYTNAPAYAVYSNLMVDTLIANASADE